MSDYQVELAKLYVYFAIALGDRTFGKAKWSMWQLNTRVLLNTNRYGRLMFCDFADWKATLDKISLN